MLCAYSAIPDGEPGRSKNASSKTLFHTVAPRIVIRLALAISQYRGSRAAALRGGARSTAMSNGLCRTACRGRCAVSCCSRPMPALRARSGLVPQCHPASSRSLVAASRHRGTGVNCPRAFRAAQHSERRLPFSRRGSRRACVERTRHPREGARRLSRVPGCRRRSTRSPPAACQSVRPRPRRRWAASIPRSARQRRRAARPRPRRWGC